MMEPSAFRLGDNNTTIVVDANNDNSAAGQFLVKKSIAEEIELPQHQNQQRRSWTKRSSSNLSSSASVAQHYFDYSRSNSNITAENEESNNQNFTNLFPSVHSSYKITEAFSVQAGYSRRIYRPRLWDLNPFFNIRNNFSIRTGNPDLLPEFTDSYELSSVYILEKVSMNFSLYQRNTTDVIERVSTFENNVTVIQQQRKIFCHAEEKEKTLQQEVIVFC